MRWTTCSCRSQLCRLPDGRQQSLRMVRTQAPQRRQTIACRSWPGSIFVKTEYRLRQIELDKILYIEGLKDYVKIYVEDEPRPVLSLISLKTLEEQLPAERFVRVHRSYIVQPSKIRIIERGRIVFGKTYIPVSDG